MEEYSYIQFDFTILKIVILAELVNLWHVTVIGNKLMLLTSYLYLVIHIIHFSGNLLDPRSKSSYLYYSF